MSEITVLIDTEPGDDYVWTLHVSHIAAFQRNIVTGREGPRGFIMSAAAADNYFAEGAPVYVSAFLRDATLVAYDRDNPPKINDVEDVPLPQSGSDHLVRVMKYEDENERPSSPVQNPSSRDRIYAATLRDTELYHGNWKVVYHDMGSHDPDFGKTRTDGGDELHSWNQERGHHTSPPFHAFILNPYAPLHEREPRTARERMNFQVDIVLSRTLPYPLAMEYIPPPRSRIYPTKPRDGSSISSRNSGASLATAEEMTARPDEPSAQPSSSAVVLKGPSPPAGPSSSDVHPTGSRSGSPKEVAVQEVPQVPAENIAPEVPAENVAPQAANGQQEDNVALPLVPEREFISFHDLRHFPSADDTLFTEESPYSNDVINAVFSNERPPVLYDDKAPIVPLNRLSKSQKKHEKTRQKKAAARAADPDLEAAHNLRLQEENLINDELMRMGDCFKKYIHNYSNIRWKYLYFRNNGYGFIDGIQKSIVQFYDTVCVFPSNFLGADEEVEQFVNGQIVDYAHRNDARMESMFRVLHGLMWYSLLICQDLAFLYDKRTSTSKDATAGYRTCVEQYYNWILQIESLDIGEPFAFNPIDFSTIPGSEFVNLEAFCRYMNRSISLRGHMELDEKELEKLTSPIEKQMTIDYHDPPPVDFHWERGDTPLYLQACIEHFESSHMDIANHFRFLKELDSELTDFDCSRLQSFEGQHSEGDSSAILVHYLANVFDTEFPGFGSNEGSRHSDDGDDLSGGNDGMGSDEKDQNSDDQTAFDEYGSSNDQSTSARGESSTM